MKAFADEKSNVIQNIKLFQSMPWFLKYLQYTSFENTVGKGEIARKEQFLHFPTVFSTHLDQI